MKPLQVIDVGMLWVARCFTAAILMLFGIPLVMLVFLSATGVILYLLYPRGTEPFLAASTSGHQMLARPQQLIDLGFALLWFFSVRLLPSLMARVCLGLTSALAFVCMCSALPVFPRMLSHGSVSPIVIVAGLMGLFGTIGFGAMLWVAVRSPQGPDVLPNSVNSV